MNAEQVAALAEAAAGDGVAFDGLQVRAEGEGFAFATVEGSGTIVHKDELEATAAEYADYVTNWYFWHAVAPESDDRWAFLRWLERAEKRPVPERYDALDEGVVRTWGQLRIEVTLAADGRRRYGLRHVDDAEAPGADLDGYEDPLDARTIATFDDRDRYRPLKTVPSLRTGWRFPDLDADELVTAVDFFYPASVANWHREREGELDVTHWTEAADRQTGIYGVLRTWNRGEGHEHVDWVAEACCVDSQCLKRREWEYDAGTDLDVDGGDGAFPCREPCSLVIAAARQWTKLEGERARTYEFELTPSEKAQIEAIVHAVADGRVDEIREADVREGANRYRARFLRAKRFDEDGTLPAVGADPGPDPDPDSDPDPGPDPGSDSGPDPDSDSDSDSGPDSDSSSDTDPGTDGD